MTTNKSFQECLCQIGDDNLVQVYPFGSRVYGSQREGSDYDYIVIVKRYPSTGSLIEVDDITMHLFTVEGFQIAIDNHDVRALEAIYLNKRLGRFLIPKNFKIDRGKLRVSFSTVANGAWIKGKKKLIVAADYDKLLAIKSIFHSIRILDFGIQLASEGDISIPSNCNWLLKELLDLSVHYEREELWEKIHSRYSSKFKEMSHVFKGLAPKELTKSFTEKEGVRNVLRSHGIVPSKELVRDLISIFNV